MSLILPKICYPFFYTGGIRITVDHDSRFPIEATGVKTDHDSRFPIEATAVLIDHASLFPIVADEDFTN